jgi:hypothetical protein
MFMLLTCLRIDLWTSRQQNENKKNVVGSLGKLEMKKRVGGVCNTHKASTQPYKPRNDTNAAYTHNQAPTTTNRKKKKIQENKPSPKHASAKPLHTSHRPSTSAQRRAFSLPRGIEKNGEAVEEERV